MSYVDAINRAFIYVSALASTNHRIKINEINLKAIPFVRETSMKLNINPNHDFPVIEQAIN